MTAPILTPDVLDRLEWKAQGSIDADVLLALIAAARRADAAEAKLTAELGQRWQAAAEEEAHYANELFAQNTELTSRAERAEAEVAKLRVALEPFARIGIPDNWPESCVLTWEETDRSEIGMGVLARVSYLSAHVAASRAPTIRDYRRAAAALAPAPETTP